MIRPLSCVLLVMLLCCESRAVAQDPPSPAETPWITLFDGRDLEGWAQTGPGGFVLDEGSLRSLGGMGLFYYADRSFRDFELELDWQANSDSANAGIFVRFPKPASPWDAVRAGYEIQIDDSQPPIHQTGSVYDFAAPFRFASRPAGEWNHYRIRVAGHRYQVWLNDEPVNDFFGDRSREGFIGLQNHDPLSVVRFRNVRVRPLPEASYPERLSDLFAVAATTPEPIRVLLLTATHEHRHDDAIATAKEVLADLSTTTELRVDATEDLRVLHPDTLARYDVLLLAHATLRTDLSPAGGSEASAALTGAWRSYALTLGTAQGDLAGHLALDGTPSSLRGTIAFDQGLPPTPLADAALTGDTLTFHFDGGEGGVMTVVAVLTGDALAGSVQAGTHTLPLAGVLQPVGAPEATASTDATGAPPRVDADQRDALLGFVQRGGGLVLAHAGLAAFYDWDAFREMAGGGLFKEHPWDQQVRVVVEEPENPAVAPFGEGIWLTEELYVLDGNPRWNSRVLASFDMEASVGINPGPADGTPNDHPVAWIRRHGLGRVFATTLGHYPATWRRPAFVEHLLQGIRLAAGRLPADFTGRRVKEVIADNVWPDDLAVDERGNVWIAELRGKIHRYDAATGDVRQIFQLPTTDPTKIEHGLYGIEIDPDFYDGSPYVYVYYAEPETFINTLARFIYRNGLLEPASRQVILRVPTEPQCCHQAGDLEWGPDGTLYVSTGDTGMSETRPDWEVSEERIQAFLQRHGLSNYHWSRLVDSERSAQNLQDLRGKILRIRKDGRIPKDNPFYGRPGVRWEIYAYGLRNPYRFKVDAETGALYIGVVGPDAAFDYDEYDLAAEGGENFGWPRTLGRLFYNEWTPSMIPDYVPPLWEYTYATGGRSAGVGPLYRHEGPGGFPAHFQDKLFLFDWSRRWIKYAEVRDGSVTTDAAQDLKTPPLEATLPARRLFNIKTFDQLTQTAPISMELGPDGCLYLAEFDGFWDAGPNARVTRYCWRTDADPLGAASPPDRPETSSGKTASNGAQQR